MIFAYRFYRFSCAAALAICFATSAASATEPKLDNETCTQLRLEHMKFVQSGAASDLERGATWAKGNLSSEKLREMELFIQLDEQIKFGCRDAKMTMDAERAAEAAKRLELNPDADPTLPLPAAGSDGDGAPDSDGTADTPDDGDNAAVAKPKSKASKKKAAAEKDAKSGDVKDDAKANAKPDDAYKAPPVVPDPVAPPVPAAPPVTVTP
jgi:hypothetical protein